MRFLTRDEIQNPAELKLIEVETPELGEDTGVRMLEPGAMARSRISDKFEDSVTGDAVIRFYAELLCETLVDENRQRMFRSPEDVEAFCERDLVFLRRLGEEASALACYTSETSIEDEVKN